MATLSPSTVHTAHTVCLQKSGLQHRPLGDAYRTASGNPCCKLTPTLHRGPSQKTDLRRAQGVDQFANAAMLDEIGTGVHLPFDEVTAETLRAAVERAVDLEPRAAEIRADVRAHGGVDTAADVVESYARLR